LTGDGSSHSASDASVGPGRNGSPGRPGLGPEAEAGADADVDADADAGSEWEAEADAEAEGGDAVALRARCGGAGTARVRGFPRSRTPGLPLQRARVHGPRAT
jgi:hypothetical protein